MNFLANSISICVSNQYRYKNPQQNISKPNLIIYSKGSYTMIKWDLFQGCKNARFNICK